MRAFSLFFSTPCDYDGKRSTSASSLPAAEIPREAEAVHTGHGTCTNTLTLSPDWLQQHKVGWFRAEEVLRLSGYRDTMLALSASLSAVTSP